MRPGPSGFTRYTVGHVTVSVTPWVRAYLTANPDVALALTTELSQVSEPLSLGLFGQSARGPWSARVGDERVESRDLMAAVIDAIRPEVPA